MSPVKHRYLDGLVSFRVTVCCVQKCGARMVIYKLIFVALV